MKIIYVQTNTAAKGGGIQGAHHTLVSTNMIWWELIVQNRAKASQSSRGGYSEDWRLGRPSHHPKRPKGTH